MEVFCIGVGWCFRVFFLVGLGVIGVVCCGRKPEVSVGILGWSRMHHAASAEMVTWILDPAMIIWYQYYFLIIPSVLMLMYYICLKWFFSEQDRSSVFFEWGHVFLYHVIYEYFCISDSCGKSRKSRVMYPWKRKTDGSTFGFHGESRCDFFHKKASNRWRVFLVSGFRMDFPLSTKNETFKISKYQFSI